MVDASVSSANRVGDRPASQGSRQHPERRSGPTAQATPPPLLVSRDDEVNLSAPDITALQVLRERVMARTRANLELSASPPTPGFAEPQVASLDQFLDRLLSQQNLLAAQRGRVWPHERIRLAVAEGMAQGAAETLDMMQEAGRVDADAVQMVLEAMAAYAKKIAAS